MSPQTAKRLLDARNASREIMGFTSGKNVADMWNDRSLQLSLHKLLEIIGEALNQAGKSDPDTALRIPNLRRFVDLRNQITHGYDSVDYAVVWQVATERVPSLVAMLDTLLAEAPPLPKID